MKTTDALCSCGCAEAHVVARRTTLDGVAVELWSDGPVTGRLGYAIDGVPMARPRTATGRSVALAAGWMLLGEVEILDAEELPAMYAACRWAAARGLVVGDARMRAADASRTVLRPVWTVLRADRDGRPTERVWRLPRLRWPGLAVWDHVSSSRGRYELMCSTMSSGRRHDETYEPTGLRFSTLAALSAHLLEA